jgi:hypothetical protein
MRCKENTTVHAAQLAIDMIMARKGNRINFSIVWRNMQPMVPGISVNIEA